MATEQCTKRRRRNPSEQAKAAAAKRLREWRKANPEKLQAQLDRAFAKHAEVMRARCRAYYATRREEANAVAKAWKQRNSDKMSRQRREWSQSNPDKTRLYATTRKAMKLNATPSWAEHEAIKAVYSQAVKWGMEVDHIVPLQSKLVCGLHVWANLQLLMPYENMSKHNSWWPDGPME